MAVRRHFAPKAEVRATTTNGRHGAESGHSVSLFEQPSRGPSTEGERSDENSSITIEA